MVLVGYLFIKMYSHPMQWYRKWKETIPSSIIWLILFAAYHTPKTFSMFPIHRCWDISWLSVRFRSDTCLIKSFVCRLFFMWILNKLVYTPNVGLKAHTNDTCIDIHDSWSIPISIWHCRLSKVAIKWDSLPCRDKEGYSDMATRWWYIGYSNIPCQKKVKMTGGAAFIIIWQPLGTTM